MDKGDYVPLWYFTNASLDDAAKAFSILEEDALSLVKRDDGLTSLVPALSLKDSRSVVEDSKLAWDDFCIAALCMILVMSQSEWPPDQIMMMMEFWTNINMHPYRSSRGPLDQSVLLLYQAEQRKLWHQAINSPGHGYDLSMINEELLHQMKDRLYWMEHELRDNVGGRDYMVSIMSHKHTGLLLMIYVLLVNPYSDHAHCQPHCILPTLNACITCHLEWWPRIAWVSLHW